MYIYGYSDGIYHATNCGKGWSGEPFVKLGDLPSNKYGSYSSIYDYPEQPYQIDDECWISFKMCCTYNNTYEGGTPWNGCYYKFASPDLINWTDVTPSGSSDEYIQTAMIGDSNCVHNSYRLEERKLQKISNNFYKEDILKPEGLIENKVDANRYERSGLVVPPGESIYVTDISGEDSVVQVWGYED